MKPNEASRTAEFNALFRAIESSRSTPGKRLFDDTLAHGFLGRLKYAYALSRAPFIGGIIPLYIDWMWPGVRISALGRTCMIDDLFRQSLGQGAGQVVILGAGYDSRAYRFNTGAVRFFEVDHPDTLKVKAGRLNLLLGSIPANVTLVPVDFDREDFAAALGASGFDSSVKTIFIWEGVVHYLTEQAVDAALRAIRALSARGSRLVFTYIHRGLLDGTVSFGALGRVKATLKRSGESWKFGMYPEELGDYLRERGFSLVSDTGSVEYRLKYIGNSRRILRGFEFYRLALAEVL